VGAIAAGADIDVGVAGGLDGVRYRLEVENAALKLELAALRAQHH
jgi:hypothetical protein